MLDIYFDGFDAFLTDRHECPYARGSAEWDHWMGGYEDGKFRFQDLGWGHV